MSGEFAGNCDPKLTSPAGALLASMPWAEEGSPITDETLIAAEREIARLWQERKRLQDGECFKAFVFLRGSMRILMDPRLTNIFLDAMILDRGKYGAAEDAAVEALLADEDLVCLLPHSVKAELKHAPAVVRQRSLELMFSAPVELTSPEQAGLRQVLQVVQGAAQAGKHDADAFHIAEAFKYGSYFVTFDGRLLKRRQKIARVRPGLAVVKPSELVHILHEYRAGRTYPDFS